MDKRSGGPKWMVGCLWGFKETDEVSDQISCGI